MKSMKLEWKRGDWAAYFGLMTNNLTNLLTMMGLLIFVVGIPKEIVYGRIAPAFGLAVLVASVCYAWFGLQMARQTGRNDVTALPSGPSAPSIFTVTFLVLMPVYQQTGDADFAIQIGLVWCFVEAMILAGGSFLGETIRKMIPRTVLLSCLSGLGLLLLAMNPMLQAFEAPTVSFIVLLLIFINWFGKKPIFARIPTGLLLLIAGTALAWISGLQSPEAIKASMSSFGFNPPEVHIDSFMQGLPHALPYLASAVPLGLANYIFDLENIESAHAAGDEYPTRKVMLANGLASMLGCLMGNPFPVTVYVGHAGWKAMGASIGYTLASGVTMFIVPLFGLGAFMLAIKALTQKGFVVIGAGGGGIPVVRTEQGDYQSVDAVIDKDLSTALLAREIRADVLVITTGVEKVCINFGKPNQQALETVNVAQMTRYMEEGHFPAGSMLPKIVASLAFLHHGGTRVIITSPDCLPAALRGETGTHIVA
ncbi:hypothetical protein LEADMM271B_22130 [Leclercia adecarboxylata]